MGIDQSVQVGRTALDIAQFAEMRQVHGARRIRHKQIDGRVHRDRVELYGCRGRKDELAAVDIHFAIGKAKCIAGKDGIAAAIDDADVMSRVPWRIEAQQLATGKVDARFVRRLDDAQSLDGDDFAVHAANLGRSIYGSGTSNEFGRIRHVAGAARVHNQSRRREGAHHRASTASMIEVYVRKDDVVDAFGTEIHRFQCLHDARERIIGAGVYNRYAAILDDEMNRRMQMAHVSGVDCTDSVRVMKNL
jgi:hypothetical protein